jgi:hypothetical protein
MSHHQGSDLAEPASSQGGATTEFKRIVTDSFDKNEVISQQHASDIILLVEHRGLRGKIEIGRKIR